jgi:hypothetical protein
MRDFGSTIYTGKPKRTEVDFYLRLKPLKIQDNIMLRRGPKTPDEKRTESARIPGQKAPAPGDLEPGAAVIWCAIVIRLPEDFFTSETVPILKAYCRHACFADYFAQEIARVRIAISAIESAMSQGKGSVRRLPKLRESLHSLHKMHGYETDHATTCATKLRLTNQSRYVRETAASKAHSTSNMGSPPWHDWGEHVPTHAHEN